MATEIERKFLVNRNEWKGQASGVMFKQAYLNSHPERTVRVRIVGDQGFITIKSKNIGISRQEFEYPIPVADAEQLLKLCETAPLEKLRYRIPYGEYIWEIDEFLGVNLGLVVAEIELHSESDQFPRPDWLGREVSDDPRYFNSNLSTYPFTHWQ